LLLNRLRPGAPSLGLRAQAAISGLIALQPLHRQLVRELVDRNAQLLGNGILHGDLLREVPEHGDHLVCRNVSACIAAKGSLLARSKRDLLGKWRLPKQALLAQGQLLAEGELLTQSKGELLARQTLLAEGKLLAQSKGELLAKQALLAEGKLLTQSERELLAKQALLAVGELLTQSERELLARRGLLAKGQLLAESGLSGVMTVLSSAVVCTRLPKARAHLRQPRELQSGELRHQVLRGIL
jgi:hypothetical protein